MRASSPLVRGYLFPLTAGLLHALLMACAFPPVGFWPLVFVAPLPLVWAGSTPRPFPTPRSGGWRRAWGSLRAPVMAAVGVLPLWAYEQIWVRQVSELGYYPMIAGMAAFAGLFVAALRMVNRRWPRLPLTLTVPLLWTAVEVFRGEIAFTGYPWMLLPHPLIDAHILHLPAAVLGVYFVDFLTSAIAGAIADIAPWRRARPGWSAAGVGGCAIVWGVVPLVAPFGPTGPGPLRIAVIQTNIPQDNKNFWKPEDRLEAFRRFSQLTRQAAAADPRPALIVWPETMFPGEAIDPWFAERLDIHAAEVADHVARLREIARTEPDETKRRRLESEASTAEERAKSWKPLLPLYRDLLLLNHDVGIPMLVGAVGFDRREGGPGEPEVSIFNSVFLLRKGRVEDTRYDKLQLTLFGEVMPYIEYWPWLQRKLLSLGASGMEFNLTPGSAPRIFDLPTPAGPVVLCTPICFEGTKSEVNRRLAGLNPDRPQVIVNLTNDGWFGSFDPARWQHLQSARWRAIELGIPVVRAANTGVSCSIDGRGNLLKTGIETTPRAARVDGVLLCDVHPSVPVTIQARIGRVFAWADVWAAGLLVLLGMVWRGQPRVKTAQTA